MSTIFGLELREILFGHFPLKKYLIYAIALGHRFGGFGHRFGASVITFAFSVIGFAWCLFLCVAL
jgi:hypothetical protein